MTKIRIRTTVITDWDKKELIIPNKAFVTGQVINWSLSDTTIRDVITVGLAYGADVSLAVHTLNNVARSHAKVLVDPAPQVLFTAFGDSALLLELRVFIAQVDWRLEVRHELLMAIEQAFRANHLEIAFPQRDIHIRSLPAHLALHRAN